MSKDGADAPTPDPAIGEAALKSAQLGEAWLKFSQDSFAVSQERQAELDALTRQVSEQQLKIGADSLAQADAARERYDTVFKPVEDSYVARAKDYATPERQDAEAAKAAADVQMAAGVARGTTERNAAAMGINPNSGRFADLNRETEMQTALASAGAANGAREAVRDKGLALEQSVINLGKGLPAEVAQATGMALGAGNSAQGLNLNASSAWAGTTGIMGAGYNGAQAGYGNQANILNSKFSQENTAYQNKVQEQSAMWQGIGTAAGVVLGGASKPWILSDETLKEDKRPLPEGEALAQLEAMPVERWKYKDGVADGGEHVGPYAQDFVNETGKGDGHTIDLQDAVGVTMKAVQDLSAKVDRLASAMGAPAGATPGRQKAQPRAVGIGRVREAA